MSSGTRRPRRGVQQLALCDPSVFGDVVLTCQGPPLITPGVMPYVPAEVPMVAQSPAALPDVRVAPRRFPHPAKHSFSAEQEQRRASALVDELLVDIYAQVNAWSDYNSATSMRSQKNARIESVVFDRLHEKGVVELRSLVESLQVHVGRIGSILVRQLKRRDALRRQREAHCNVITLHLQKRAPEDDTQMRFSIAPSSGESGFGQWQSAMKMVARLPGGIPPEFRRTLWLNLAEKHLSARGVDWPMVERNCLSEWSHPADAELGVQIVKDLHRTGCSMFCGEDGQENQALLKKVLLAYARWNKAVGYCQGFNMLAALILQVTERCEADALKLMIYLIEGVLPDSYFADSLRGLSVDMAVFRELLRTRLPRLSRHLDNLQKASKEGTTSYEPPLTNVFTMQWFLTLFCNCLPQETVLRVWDLILLEGNEILLRTALAIWQAVADRILGVRSADEFYCIMGVLTREMLEFGFVDANSLIKAIVCIGPLTELKSLRDHYLYNINPWAAGPCPTSTAVYEGDDKQLKSYPKERLVLDIGVLKKQYVKLKQRQRQAHIIFSAAVSRHPQRPAPVAMNHLLLGKSALVSVRRLGPPQGSIPPPRKQIATTSVTPPAPTPVTTLHWKDAPRQSSSSSSSDTELCDDPDNRSSDDDERNEQVPHGDSPSKNLIKNDNTSSHDGIEIETRITSPTDNDVSPELLVRRTDTNHLTLDDAPFELNESTGSDDGFDFEKFLEERIRCLKESSMTVDSENTIADASGEIEKISQGRKNSERALEIIQENSLILHRILQCQSRYSPIPIEDENLSSETNDVVQLKDDQVSPEVKFVRSSSVDSDENQTMVRLDKPICDVSPVSEKRRFDKTDITECNLTVAKNCVNLQPANLDENRLYETRLLVSSTTVSDSEVKYDENTWSRKDFDVETNLSEAIEIIECPSSVPSTTPPSNDIQRYIPDGVELDSNGVSTRHAIKDTRSNLISLLTENTMERLVTHDIISAAEEPTTCNSSVDNSQSVETDRNGMESNGVQFSTSITQQNESLIYPLYSNPSIECEREQNVNIYEFLDDEMRISNKVDKLSQNYNKSHHERDLSMKFDAEEFDLRPSRGKLDFASNLLGSSHDESFAGRKIQDDNVTRSADSGCDDLFKERLNFDNKNLESDFVSAAFPTDVVKAATSPSGLNESKLSRNYIDFHLPAYNQGDKKPEGNNSCSDGILLDESMNGTHLGADAREAHSIEREKIAIYVGDDINSKVNDLNLGQNNTSKLLKLERNRDDKEAVNLNPMKTSASENICEGGASGATSKEIIPISERLDEQADFDRLSKYRDILAYSKNLDERYNTLIVKNWKSEDASSKSEADLALEVRMKSKSVERHPPASPSSRKPEHRSMFDSSTELSRKSPARDSHVDDSGPKSPNHIYNPFPVKLSSRQNKDVAVRLGLYKK